MNPSDPKPTPPPVSPGMFDHLLLCGRDPRTPAERAADEARERARRAGRGRRDWWKTTQG